VQRVQRQHELAETCGNFEVSGKGDSGNFDYSTKTPTTYRGRLTGSRHLVRVDIVSVSIAAPAVQLGRAPHLTRHHLQKIRDFLSIFEILKKEG
jgi:hypothetical protein